MPLTLTIRNAAGLENGSPLSLVLDRRGAKIGRAATADWCLPDPSLHISSQHCEIRFADERYELIDYSTNGTFLLGQGARLGGPHAINQGDVFVIGRFEVEAGLGDAAAADAALRNAAPPPPPQWQGWAAAAGQPQQPGGHGPAPGAPQNQSSGPPGWEQPPVWLPEPSPTAGAGPGPSAPAPASDDWAPRGDAASGAGTGAAGVGTGWAPPPAAPAHPAPAPAGSPWNVGPAEQASPASGWSSPAAPAHTSANDIWGKFAASNDVDWARGGFGQSAVPPATAPTANFVPPPTAQTPAQTQPRGPEQLTAPRAEAIAPAVPGPPAGPPPETDQALAALAAATGVERGRLQLAETQTVSLAGALLRKLVGGLVILLEARSRAKSQMGARGTSLELDGNNPLKFARTPEQALVQLLNPAERGFMESERAIEDAFKDLQAHQMATLLAMQGALRVTLERFSPNAIRARAEKKGVLSRILPGARDAALWKAYEKDFSQVSLGSDEAFMDVFAKEFRRAYDEISTRS